MHSWKKGNLIFHQIFRSYAGAKSRRNITKKFPSLQFFPKNRNYICNIYIFNKFGSFFRRGFFFFFSLQNYIKYD